MEEKVKYVSIKEIASDCQQSSMRDKALLRNPFIKEMDCSKLVFMMGDESVGSVTTLPLQIVAYGNIYSVCAGSNLSVDSRFRGQGIATKLTMRRLSLSKDKIAIASGLSNMSFPLFIKVTMFVIQMKNALRGLSAPAAWQTPEKFFI